MDNFFSTVCNTGGERLDQFLAAETGLSRSRVQSLIKDGLIFVSGMPQKASMKLAAGDVIEGEIPASAPLDALPADIPLDIVYEDSQIIVINKPKNMVVHPAPGHINDTLVNALLYHCGDSLSGINGTLRPGIIHRLDKDTTGLIIVAKTDEAHISLSRQLKNHEIERVYEAIVFGETDDSGTINAPIGRHPKNRLKMGVIGGGREAVTHYRVLSRFNRFTHIEARLETGRTHQIRVHMAHIGFPVLGDALYTNRKQPFGLCSQTLHAKSVTFTHPANQKRISLKSELPGYFSELLTKLWNM